MAIEFKSAPKSASSSDSGGFDIVAMLADAGKLNIAMLIGLVLVIFIVVTYLRTTPGYRVTDIRLNRGEKKEAKIKRIRPPTDEEVRAAEQRGA